MLTRYGHLTYCTNIHEGETWADHFGNLRTNFPLVKAQTAPNQPLGMGLRLSDRASRDLSQPRALEEFKDWLSNQHAYVFTMNGFPFGAFHGDTVKAHVHTPDWTTDARVAYTLRLFDLLADLIPEDLEGGISTSPLGYRHRYTDTENNWRSMREQATQHIINVTEHLINIRHDRGITLHLDIEPEPDGVLETGPEFITWFEDELIPGGVATLAKRLQLTHTAAEEALRRHVRLCYDVCHFALGYEDHAAVVDTLNRHAIQIGKFQLSAAVSAMLPADRAIRQQVGRAFMAFDESTYLHQVLARHQQGTILRFKDLPDAQACLYDEQVVEWRAHFHVPVFFEDLGLLKSTQADIIEVLALQKERQLTSHLEVETYTWQVLPPRLQLPIADSISRELNWILDKF